LGGRTVLLHSDCLCLSVMENQMLWQVKEAVGSHPLEYLQPCLSQRWC
jgi:hypothetical protein